MNKHTADFDGQTFTRTSQNRTYTHAVVVTTEADGIRTSAAWSWSGSHQLALKAAATHRVGHVMYGGRKIVAVTVVPATVEAKTVKAMDPQKKAKSLAARRAGNLGEAAADYIRRAVASKQDLSDYAMDLVRGAVRNGNLRLDLEDGTVGQ
jgi:hypothetical protein